MPSWRWTVFALFELAAHACDLASKALIHVGAGVLRAEQLPRAIAQQWQNFGASERYVLSGLMPWEKAFYGRFLERDDDVLVVGCGTGRDLIALLKAGHRVNGVDIAPEAAKTARALLIKHNLHADIAAGAIEDVALARPFDAYIFSWFCYSYIPGRARRVAVLRKVREHLKPGGRILISYVLADGPLRRRSVALTAIIARLTRSAWRPEPTDVISSDGCGVHFEHRFEPAELEQEARDAGLDVAFHAADEEGTAVLVSRPTSA